MQKDATTLENGLINHILGIWLNNSTPKYLFEICVHEEYKIVQRKLIDNSQKLKIPQIAIDK